MNVRVTLRMEVETRKRCGLLRHAEPLGCTVGEHVACEERV